jgi:hypothetical protein
LDEQLHAGFYFFLLTSQRTFVSNSGFVYPIVLILVGYLAFNMIGFYDYHKAQGGRDPHMIPAFGFMAGAYAVGFLVMLVPRLYLE